MNEEEKKEIEKISDIISENIEFEDVGGGSVSIDEDKVAEALYNAGYRKVFPIVFEGKEYSEDEEEQMALGEAMCESCQRKAIKEFAEKLKRFFNKKLYCYWVDTGTLWNSLQIGDNINDQIDKLLKEYGIGEER